MKKCPVCAGVDLSPVMTKQGVEIDICPHCQGIWLDKNEIYLFSHIPTYLRSKLQEALEKQTPTQRLCPITNQPMVELPMLDGEVKIDYSPHSEGIWLDKGEADRLPLLKSRIDIDKGFSGISTKQPQPQVPPGPPRLLPLPNLAFHSGMVLFSMYAVLTLFLISAVEFFGLTPSLALLIGFITVFFHFLLGPFFMDLSLRFLYKIRWVQPSELPPHLRQFIGRVCQEKKINFPQMGIIIDGAPNAFTYGHHPNNARIVITQGLLDLLTEEETETVVAHEIGHAVHWDMLVMTLAQLVPLILYYIYRTLIRMRSRGRDKSAGARIAIAITAYILYIISEYIVLWFSRIREYFADRFAGEITGKPNHLASALVKIGYGLAGEESTVTKEEKAKRSEKMKSIGALGIFDAGRAGILAISGYSGPQRMGKEINKETLKDVAKWDLWNPWAVYYELHSTHPLIAKRIQYLSNQSRVLGQEPFVEFDKRKPESYWDDFLMDLFIKFLPALAFVVSLILFAINQQLFYLKLGSFLFGIAWLLQIWYSYPNGNFVPLNIKNLLKKIKVSAINPVPCHIKGTIIGRGIPGLIYSEDFVMQDETGIIFLDYQQPLGLFNFLFGLLRAAHYVNEPVDVIGWYRRAPTPYVEIKKIIVNGKESNCYVYQAKLFMAIMLSVFGLFLSVGIFG